MSKDKESKEPSAAAAPAVAAPAVTAQPAAAPAAVAEPAPRPLPPLDRVISAIRALADTLTTEQRAEIIEATMHRPEPIRAPSPYDGAREFMFRVSWGNKPVREIIAVNPDEAWSAYCDGEKTWPNRKGAAIEMIGPVDELHEKTEADRAARPKMRRLWLLPPPLVRKRTMATDLENLIAARSAILAALATDAAKPNYSIDGQTVSRDSLFDRLEKLNEAIAAVQGGFEVRSQVA